MVVGLTIVPAFFSSLGLGTQPHFDLTLTLGLLARSGISHSVDNVVQSGTSLSAGAVSNNVCNVLCDTGAGGVDIKTLLVSR
jgi:hypothetical protein